MDESTASTASGTHSARAWLREVFRSELGHRDLATTQVYAACSPCEREAEMVTAAFAEPVAPSELLTAAKP